MIYIITLCISKQDRDKIRGILPSHCCSSYEWDYDKDTNTFTTLYAWTDDKKIFKKFKKTRNSKYFKYTKLDDDYVEKSCDDLSKSIKLEDYSYVDSESTINIVSTEHEYLNATEDVCIQLMEDNSLVLPDTELFKKDVMDILDKFGYSYLFYTSIVEPLPFEENVGFYQEDLSGRQEAFMYNLSFSRDANTFITSNGFGNMPKTNEFKSFIYYYGGLMSY